MCIRDRACELGTRGICGLTLRLERLLGTRRTLSIGTRVSRLARPCGLADLTGTPGTNLRVDWINRYGPIDAWVTLATVPLTSASQTYVDLTMIRQPPRLYRLVPVP